MLLYDLFYRNYGIRKAGQMLSPPLPSLERLELPRRSLLHFTNANPLEGGPVSDEFILQGIAKPIQMAHITELKDTKGSPRRLPVAVDPLVRKYHLRHRRFRQMRDLEHAARDDQTLLMYNYGFLPPLYRYPRSYYSDYYKWINLESTVWHTAAELAQQSERHQFIVCTLPQILPSLSDLKIGVTGVSQRMVTIFNTPESLVLLELWKWFGEERGDSLLSVLPADKLDRINLLFLESGHWFVLNLGLLNSWRLPGKQEAEANPQLKKTIGLQPQAMQRQFLRLMMSLQHVRTTAPAEVDQVVDAADVAQAPPEAPLSAPGEEPTVIKVEPKIPQKDAQGTIQPPAAQQSVDAGLQTAEQSKTDTAEDVVKAQTAAVQKKIDDDLAQLEEISRAVQERTQEREEAPALQVIEAKTLEQGVMDVCDRLADQGMLSAAEYKRYGQLAATYRKLPAPDGKGTLDKFIEVPKQVLQIEESPQLPDIPSVVDKSMLKSSLLAFDQRYTQQVLQKDVAGMVLNLQRAGLAVTEYEAEHVSDVLGDYYDYRVRVVPVEGAASTFRFKLPAVQEDGTYQANGVKYRMRKQRGDLPIRKISPERVALTSYYGKTFVSRSTKKVNDYGDWLRREVMAKGLSAEDTTISEMQPANVFDNTFKAPKVYSALAQGFRAFTVNHPASKSIWKLNFDHTQHDKLYTTEQLRAQGKRDIIVGKSTKDDILLLDQRGMLYVVPKGDPTARYQQLCPIEEFLGLASEKAPVDFAELKVLGRPIPLGLVLGYEMGLERLMKLLKVEPRRVPAGTRVNLDESEYALVFSDETLVFSRDDRMAAMVLAGFNEYHRAIRVYAVHEFDRPGVYLNVLESQGPSARYLREIDLLYRLFVDPITRDLLVEMREPTDLRGLLLRGSEMLLDDAHPDELDPAYMRIKGYERLAGAVYSELVRSVRAHSGRAGRAKAPLDLNPYAVWKTVAQDPAIALVSDINPIENLKQVEAVTMSGTGGRQSRSMTKHTRAYHPNDMGTISESTVDSSDVAINTFLSGDPQFTSLRGISRRYKIGQTGATALMSTSALVSPGSDRDDPKRVNFIGIQMAHGVACSGYHQAAVRTGYEQVIPHRTSDLFAYTAKKPGKVVSVSDTGMVVQFADGEIKGFELGRRYGAAAGLTIPHEVVTTLKAGQSFKEGDLLVHNPGFFEPDVLNPAGVAWKAGVIVNTVLLESTQTLEDSSAISQRAAQLLTTKTTKVKSIVVTFDQSVRQLIKEGTPVEAEDILCIIEDAVTANSGLFDESSLDTLRVLSAQTPQAKAKGVVERIEVYYHGDKEDMSESLRAIANASDRAMAQRLRSAGKAPHTGRVDDGFRIDGDPLQLDTLCIRVYITADVPAGVGDKGVFANQMKTVFGEVMTGEITTESGKPIDAIFGQKSIADRIVLSPELIGTTTTLLDVIAKEALKAYEGK